MVEIVPSILSADFARLGEEIARVEAAGVSMLHLDVMDGHFVPNITIGPPVVASIRKATRLTLDVHLMIEQPDRHIPSFIGAGADQVSVHQETCPHLDRTLHLIQEEGARAGVVLNPATPLSYLDYVMDKVDMVLLMSVNPGFGGQSFIPGTLNKLREARARIDASGLDIRLEIDGGVKVDNIAEIAAAGADTFVAGSAIFSAHQASDPHGYDTVIKQMRAALAKQ